MNLTADRAPIFPPDVLMRALDARDPRFDGLFFVGIITTMVYCRPVCPARVSHPERRRFFDSAAAAEHAGFRPCLRCRPELAPGRALIDAVPRLASQAAYRITAGALNGQHVADLARELGVSARHLRRALQRELGVSPLELALTQRLLLAKHLLADTSLSVTRVAYASGFQSLRRFNAVFHDRYRISPSMVRRRLPRRNGRGRAVPVDGSTTEPTAATDLVRLTLAYRAPLAWSALTTMLRHDAIPGVEWVEGERYGRTVDLNGKRGVVFAADAVAGAGTGNGRRAAAAHLDVEVSPALVPVLMPLLARLRQLFDLDAEPRVVQEVLEKGGLGYLVRAEAGLRVPGAFDGFEVVLRLLLGGPGLGAPPGSGLALLRRVVEALGEPIATGYPSLTHLVPTAARVAGLDHAGLIALGVPRRSAVTLLALARAVAVGSVRLTPGSDVPATQRALLAIPGLSDTHATAIVMHALHWPDAFPAFDFSLQRAAGASTPRALATRAEAWRPWRAYAAVHLWWEDSRQPGAEVRSEE